MFIRPKRAGLASRRLAVAVLLLAAADVTAAATSGWDAAAASAKAKPGTTIEGRFGVGAYKLYLRCEGTGSPVIV